MLLAVCRLGVILPKECHADLPSCNGAMPRIQTPTLRLVLANNVRAYRKNHGFSQEELADRCGLHRTYIGSVERQERNVTLNTLEVLAKALGVSVPLLLTKGAINVGKRS